MSWNRRLALWTQRALGSRLLQDPPKIYGAKKDGQLLVTSGWAETYVISASDKAVGRQVYLHGIFDFDRLELCVKILGKNFTCETLIDVGANIGTTCIPAVKRGIFRQAIAFEPEPLNYSLLCANVALNGLQAKIQSHNTAIGAQLRQRLNFELSNENFGDHRVRVSENDGSDQEASRHVIQVPSTTLDSIIKKIEPTSTLIWIDTQGYEGEVFKGATKILAQRPPILFEFWPYGLNRSGGFPYLKEAVKKAGHQKMKDLRKPDNTFMLQDATFESLYSELLATNTHTDLLIY